MMRLILLVLAVVMTLSASVGALAESIPIAGQRDARVRTVSYHADDIIRLQGFVGYSIELVFEEGETFAGEGGGDLDGITFGAHDHQLIVKPHAANVGTNFVVYTDKRAYRFDYTVLERRPNALTDEVVYVVRFVYPDSSAAPERTAADVVADRLTAVRAAPPRNLDYWFCGARSLKPIAASDDGVQTRLTFGGRSEWPAVFVRNEDNSESLLNFSVEVGDMVIHRVAPAFILRRGRLTACVVNKGFEGSGARLSSGTLSPSVVRERKGTRP